MPLSPGTRLGPYEILAPLGAGGMGEVYRARDSRLGREVAIKVLPASFSQDTDRLRRFEHEARAAGVLNHPNITAVYDFGSAEGSPYVVTELLEGETLRSRIATGALSTRKAIDYAIQIARGLSAAHEKGIVHRDLKPENLFVTKDGRVKILDFGLAKLTHPERAGTPVTEAPTETRGTEPGVVMGTVEYMSPEQVRGQTADQRSDMFAFGAILYEMLSGKRAFHGATVADTMSAILKEEPRDLLITNQNVSPGLERIVRHCLEKNPDERFHSAHDLAFDLEALGGISGPRAAASSPAAEKKRAAWLLAAAVGVILAAILTSILAYGVGKKAGHVPPPLFHRLTYRRGFVSSARFAPDGQTVFYAASWDGAEKPQLFSTRVENPGSLRLGLPDGQVESISRSGEMLILSNVVYGGGYTHRGTLSSASLSGAAARDLLEDVAEADWSPDGRSLALVRAPQWRYRLEFPAGKVLYETTGWISHPRVSPRGDAVAFLDHPVFGDDRGAVAIVDQSGKKTTLSTGWDSTQGLAWSASGDEVWFTASTPRDALYAVTRSGRRRLIVSSHGILTLQDISKDGRVLIDCANERVGLLGLSAADAKERDLSGLDWSRGPILSEDGKTLVFSELGAGGGVGYSVYLRRMDGSPAIRLGEGEALALSPDGKWVLAALVRSSPVSLILLPSGAGEARPLPKDSINHEGGAREGAVRGVASFFPDGRRIIFVGSEPGHARRSWIQDLDGGKPRPVSPEGVVGALLSPDGRFFVGRGPDQKPALYPVEAGPPRPIKGLEPSDRTVGRSADGKLLFVRPLGRSLTARVYSVDVASGRRELWKEFAPRDPTGLTDISADAITPDGKTLVFAYHHILSDLYVVEGLK